jgi:hypothetical protein
MNSEESYVRQDVFKEYAEKIDERCGNHEALILEVKKKLDKNGNLLSGLIISLLLVFAGLVVDILRGALT